MRNHLWLIFCVWILGCSAAQPPLKNAAAAASVPPVHSILRQASQLALMQSAEEHFWTQTVLLQIAEQQTRASDFDGALQSISGSNYPYGRELALWDLAKTLARSGNKDRAIEVSRMVDSSWGGATDALTDDLLQQWIKHLIGTSHLQLAAATVEQIKAPEKRGESLQELAVALAKSGDPERASKYFSQAQEAALGVNEDYYRAQCLWEIGEAQRLVGFADAAHETLRRLADMADDFKDSWAKVAALRECAVLAAKSGDKNAAHSLFGRAIESQKAVNEMNKLGALEQIAIAQASVGFIQDAQKTAAMILHSERDFTQDSNREAALSAIAVVQVNTGDTEGAVATSLSVKYFIQYRDDALRSIVAHHIDKGDLKAALATTQYFHNPTRKASAILKVAAAQAKAGNRKAAADIAAQIKLTHPSDIPQIFNHSNEPFDYRKPQTWCENYESNMAFTMTSYSMSVQRTAEFAAGAMELAQTLDYKPDQSYAELFDETAGAEITESLARAHARFGDSNEAIAWAKRIGRSEKIKKGDDSSTRRAVEQRIHALLGAAEGMLDRVEGQ